jgi:hypothetical protein
MEKSTSNKEFIFQHFWCINPKGEISIHHEGLIQFFKSKGFCWLASTDSKQLVRKEGNILSETDITDVVNLTYTFLNSPQVPDSLGNGASKKELINLFVRGIDNYINQAKLRLLPIIKLDQHRDKPGKSYFYCKDVVVEITADDINVGGYAALDSYVWKNQIKPHTFQLLDSDASPGDFETFALRICDNNMEKFESLQTILGYTLHRYWSPSNSIIPCLLDETVVGDEEAQGGTGKTLLCQGLSYIRSMVDVDGKNFKTGANFAFQRVSASTEILFVDDLHRAAIFEDWFSIVSNGLEINKKFKAAVKMQKEFSPKIILTSNFPIRSIAGFSTERRKIELEIGTYYGPERKPKDEFKRDFFQEWEDDEFNKMYNFFARCIQKYFKSGIIQPPSVNSSLRKLITELGSEDLLQFLDEKVHMRNTERFHKRDMYEEFLKSNPGQNRYYPSQNRFIRKVHKYFEHHKIQYRETPLATRAVMEIIDWGNVPVPEEEILEPDKEIKTLADTLHTYTVIDTTPDENQ